jgi:hypothetical protein
VCADPGSRIVPPPNKLKIRWVTVGTFMLRKIVNQTLGMKRNYFEEVYKNITLSKGKPYCPIKYTLIYEYT